MVTLIKLSEEIAEQTEGLTKKQSREIFEKAFDLIKDYVDKGEKVSIKDFGRFEKKIRNARNCINPATGETMTTKKKEILGFKSSHTYTEE